MCAHLCFLVFLSATAFFEDGYDLGFALKPGWNSPSYKEVLCPLEAPERATRHALKPGCVKSASSITPYPHVRVLSVVHNNRILSIVSRISTRIVVLWALFM